MFSLGSKDEEEEHYGKRALYNSNFDNKKTNDIISAIIENIILTMILNGMQLNFNVILINFKGSFFIYLCNH